MGRKGVLPSHLAAAAYYDVIAACGEAIWDHEVAYGYEVEAFKNRASESGVTGFDDDDLRNEAYHEFLENCRVTRDLLGNDWPNDRD
jgi:hypothetical protein